MMASNLESKLYSAYWDDGLVDLFFGLGVAAIGASWAFDLVALGAAAPAMLIPIWMKLRRTVVEPRSGFAEFSDARVAKNRQWFWVALAFGVMFLAVGIGTYLFLRAAPGELLPRIIPGLPAALLGLLAALGAMAMGVPRGFIYAGVLTICGAVVAVFSLEPHVGMIAGGVLITLCGALVFVRFLQSNTEEG